jgi:chromosome segregation ATPase
MQSDIAHVEESLNPMPDEHRIMADREVAIELAGVSARLDAIHSEVTRLANQVEKQNGRVGKLEQERAAQQARSVDAARSEVGIDRQLETILGNCECRMGTMSNRVSELEKLGNQAAGGVKMMISVIRDAAMILTLFLFAWQTVGNRAEHRPPEAAPQHQAVK